MKKSKTKTDPYLDREKKKYKNPVASREHILDCLEKIGKPVGWSDLLDYLNISQRGDKQGIKRRLKAMLRDGQLMQDRRHRFCIVDKLPLVKGRIQAHSDGYGFLLPEESDDDVFISPKEMRNVLHGDLVLASVISSNQKGKAEAVIREILQVNDKPIIGRYLLSKGASVVKPEDRRFKTPILISDPPPNIHSEDIVLVKLLNHPSEQKPLEGEIIEAIGHDKLPGLETEIAIRNHDIPYEWPKQLNKDLAQLTQPKSGQYPDGFTDLTELPFVTIDGDDAKDFDDAVFCQQHKNGWRLFVAIAHVSHYVTPGSPLDKEAKNRGTSVYFPNRVIPMLPELLSNDLCSLKPNVPRLAVVCEMNINEDANVTRSKFYEAVILSNARLTYTEVAKWFDNPKKAPKENYWNSVKELRELHNCLQKHRQKRGALAFDFPETKIEFNDELKVAKIKPTKRLISHTMIEEAMLVANVTAAKYILRHKLPGLFRNHPAPSQKAVQELCAILRLPGFKRVKDTIEPQWVAQLLETLRKRPDGEFLQIMVLQSMEQANYSPKNEGHFGLAYKSYLHFTSPIRRYPDLYTHRLICQTLHDKSDQEQLNKKAVNELAEHCSITERRAEDAVREVVGWLKCEYMLDHLGKAYHGIVRGVTDFGLFVQLETLYVEGLVHVSALKNDYYRHEPQQFRLKGERSGAIYQIGQRIEVRVANVNLQDRKIDFELVE